MNPSNKENYKFCEECRAFYLIKNSNKTRCEVCGSIYYKDSEKYKEKNKIEENKA